MRVSEIINNIHCYAAAIRAKHGKGNVMVKTIVWANGFSEARALLTAAYGDDSVISLSRVADDALSEAAPRRTTTTLLPTLSKHDLAQRALLNHLRLKASRLNPTVDDLDATKSDLDAEQKKIDREYENTLKWTEIRKRRI